MEKQNEPLSEKAFNLLKPDGYYEGATGVIKKDDVKQVVKEFVDKINNMQEEAESNYTDGDSIVSSYEVMEVFKDKFGFEEF